MNETRPGKLFVVGTPIGNMEDITLRALRVLSSVEIICAEDTRSVQHLLSHHQVRAGAAPARILSFFAGNEAARTDEVIGLLRDGHDIALVSEAGMPGISDPGQRLVAAAQDQRIRVEVIPGPSAALHALVASGLPSERFVFLGFPPRSEGQRLQLFGSLRHEPGTLIFYESPERVAQTVADLATALGADRRAVVARELTKLFEEHRRGTLGELAHSLIAQPPRGEITLVVHGADAQSTQPTAETLNVEQEIRRRLAQGESAKDIATALTVILGQPRRKLYQLALHLKETSDEATSLDGVPAG
jgi:16S rRNA (cytidine1402-2'-O)-methyltransferase